MYIEPNSTIKIYHNVPLDNTYEHTLYFASISAQNNYFHGGGNVKYTLSAQSYQRVVKGSMRVGVKADNLYDCNYLAFQNTNFGTKWFYAFITGVEYVNNETSQITFEIDCMQTYMFDVSLKDCFVEREHSLTDEAGDNIIDEPVNLGDITCNAIADTGWFDSYVCVIASAFDPSTTHVGGVQGGLFSGLHYSAGLINNDAQVDDMVTLLERITSANKADSVVSLFMMPSHFYPQTKDLVIDSKRVAKATDIHGYVPRNKKLLTFPYNYLGVDCGNNDAIYRYEWFASDTCDFSFMSSLSCNPQIAMIPFSYNGVALNDLNWGEKLVMEDFPQVGWSIDAYKQWLAREASQTALGLLGGAVAMGAGIYTGNALMASAGVASIGASAMGKWLAQNRPNQSKGTNNGSIDCAIRCKDFYFKQMQISEQSARIIDDFFTMYGYQTNRVKVPNRSGRPHWNYVKTKGCIVVGSAPADEIRHICEIYDHGITFWKNASEVGNYALDNSPA